MTRLYLKEKYCVGEEPMGLSAPPPGCPPGVLDVAMAYDVNWKANCICLH